MLPNSYPYSVRDCVFANSIVRLRVVHCILNKAYKYYFPYYSDYAHQLEL